MRPGSRRRARALRGAGRERGFTYLGVLFVVTLVGLGLAGTAETWTIASRRAKERALLWTGNQYARALKSYRDQSPGVKQYPVRLEELVEDRRFPAPKHHLRELYVDPITRSEWDTVLDPTGRIAGVRSRSSDTPLKQAGFPLKWQDFKGLTRYSDWQFVADGARQPASAAAGSAPPAGATAAPAAPATAVPGSFSNSNNVGGLAPGAALRSR